MTTVGARLYRPANFALQARRPIEVLVRLDTQCGARLRIELRRDRDDARISTRLSVRACAIRAEDAPGDRRLVASTRPDREGAAGPVADADGKTPTGTPNGTCSMRLRSTRPRRAEPPRPMSTPRSSVWAVWPTRRSEPRMDRPNVDRVLALRPTTVLEIGFGTGQLLTRIASQLRAIRRSGLLRSRVENLHDSSPNRATSSPLTLACRMATTSPVSRPDHSIR